MFKDQPIARVQAMPKSTLLLTIGIAATAGFCFILLFRSLQVRRKVLNAADAELDAALADSSPSSDPVNTY